MNKYILSLLLALSMAAAPFFRPNLQAADNDRDFAEKTAKAVALLYSQGADGAMQMRCTVTAYEMKPTGKNLNIYKFLSAAQCVGGDRVDKEKSASTANTPFFITFDESKGSKRFWPAKVLWVGYQSRGEDFSVFEVASAEEWETIPIGDEHKLKSGAGYWNIASPLGLGKQIQEGVIANIDLDRPIVEGDINWSHTMVLQQTGVNGGSSGSAIISKETRTIVGTLVGSIANSTIIGIPISRFVAIQKAVDAKKYKYWSPEVAIGPDGSPIEDK